MASPQVNSEPPLQPLPSETTPASKTTFYIGTRKSKLALLQTEIVMEALKSAWPDYNFDIFSMKTAGDLDKITPLKDLPSKNLWTQELEELLISKKLDFIVHSLKDVPTQIPSSCTLSAIMTREDPRDALVMKAGHPPRSIAELPAGSMIGTSSIRRAAQIAWKYPRLRIADMRGNVGTRLAKLDAEDGECTCLILAAAGLKRLDLGHRVTQYLDSKNGGMLYAVGQGALGIEIRADDWVTERLLAKIADKETTLACLAERSLLRTLEGGCSAPLGVETEWVHGSHGKKLLRMRAVVVSVDGKDHAEIEQDGAIESINAAEEFGTEVARALSEKGAGAILEVIQQNKKT